MICGVVVVAPSWVVMVNGDGDGGAWCGQLKDFAGRKIDMWRRILAGRKICGENNGGKLRAELTTRLIFAPILIDNNSTVCRPSMKEEDAPDPSQIKALAT